MNIYNPAKKIAEDIVRNAMAACESKRRTKKECNKKQIIVVHGYILERVCPSGLFKVKYERLGTVVYVSKKRAMQIAYDNATIE